MAVPGRDLSDETGEFIPSPDRPQYDTSFPIESQVHRIPFSKAGLFRDCKWDPDCQAVPPLCNPGIVSHGCLYLSSSGWSANPDIGLIRPIPDMSHSVYLTAGGGFSVR